MTPITDFWRGRPYAAALIALLLFVLAGLFDESLATKAAHAAPGFKTFGKAVSIFGLSGYMLAIAAIIVLAAAAALRRGHERVLGQQLRLLAERASYFFATIALSGIFAQIIKHTLGRARPKLMPDVGAYHFDPLSLKSSLASFPSGHTTTAFAAAFCLSCFAPRAWPLFYACALLIAAARLLAGEHYPSDIVAGAVLGTLTAFWLARAFGARNVAFDSLGPKLRLKREVFYASRAHP